MNPTRTRSNNSHLSFWLPKEGSGGGRKKTNEKKERRVHSESDLETRGRQTPAPLRRRDWRSLNRWKGSYLRFRLDGPALEVVIEAWERKWDANESEGGKKIKVEGVREHSFESHKD